MGRDFAHIFYAVDIKVKVLSPEPRGGGGGGGGVTPLYKEYRYVPSQRVWFLSRFGLK